MNQKGKDNKNVETQELDSQCDTSQQFFSCDDYLDVWGTLKESRTGELFGLKNELINFGREAVSTSNAVNYIFDLKKYNTSIYERISRSHFKIERKMSVDLSKPNYEPAIITCLGRNGLIVGTTKMSMNEKRVLKDNQWICLPPGIKLFFFTYTKSEEMYIEKSCSIHEKFYIGEILGRGACGEVRKVTSIIPTGNEIFENYAIKCIEKPKENLSRSKEDEFRAFENEVKIMRKVNYIHVLRLFDVYETSQNIYLLFPYMSGGDLLTKILNSPSKCLSEDESKYYFMQLVYGIKYLHDRKITHRDIKPENILLTDNGQNPILMIADFGLSKMNDVMKTQCGTEVYVAPEILKKKGHYTNAVDIWSAGVFLFAMLTGKMPFSSNHKGTLHQNILAGRFEFSPSSIWSKIPTAKNIITFMLQTNPKHRLTAEQLNNHRWLCDEKVTRRLERAYAESNWKNIEFSQNDESVTEDLERTMINVSINEDENPRKRRKLF